MEPLPQSRLRTACTRCHAQKLRCPGRQEGERSCSRCKKANATCIFGTSVRGKRPATVAAQGLRTALDMDDDFPIAKRTHEEKSTALQTRGSNYMPDQSSPLSTTIDWNVVSIDTEITHPQAASPYTSTPNTINPVTIEDPHIQIVATLTQLNLDLLRHAKTIPPLTSQPPNITKDFVPFNLDDTFQLTTSFLETVRPLHLQESPEICSSSSSIVVDSGTVFLAISCWRRLADIYDSLFIHVRRCAEQSVLPATKEGNPITLPLLTIGRFVPDATTSILLQMVATLQHSTQLANGMSEFASKMSRSWEPASGNELGSVDLHCHADAIHQQIRSIKSLLAEIGHL
ncbi:hypothetical protein Daesc_000139 [Daldinia eschscholtzii]|uniref:Zn(2)-C6 fungal-type domain-containing protein n=1 Tax=Daldinia eschscholtzii TaxID=292717 RepID=A0AAX6MXM3_9PEZI